MKFQKNRVMRRKIILIGILLFTISSCKRDHKLLSEIEKIKIKNCINYIKNNNDIGLTNCYLIKPYFSDFNISSFFESPDISFKSLFKEKSTEDYLKIQNRVNLEFSGKYNSNFEQLTTCERGNYIIEFSGFSKNMVISYLKKSHKTVSKKELLDKTNLEHNEIIFYIFIFNNEGKITNVLENVLTFW